MKLTATSVDGVLQGRTGWFGRGGAAEVPETALELVQPRTTPKGVTIQIHRDAGRPGCGTADVEECRTREEES